MATRTETIEDCGCGCTVPCAERDISCCTACGGNLPDTFSVVFTGDYDSYNTGVTGTATLTKNAGRCCLWNGTVTLTPSGLDEFGDPIPPFNVPVGLYYRKDGGTCFWRLSVGSSLASTCAGILDTFGLNCYTTDPAQFQSPVQTSDWNCHSTITVAIYFPGSGGCSYRNLSCTITQGSNTACVCKPPCYDDIIAAYPALTLTTVNGATTATGTLSALTNPGDTPTLSTAIVTGRGTWKFFVVPIINAVECYDDSLNGYGVATEGDYDDTGLYQVYSAWYDNSGACKLTWKIDVRKISDSSIHTITITLSY